MPLPWSDNLATFGGVYTQADSRLVFFWTARLTLAADAQAVSGRISWHRGTGPVAASNYIGTHCTYLGDEIVQGEYVAAAGPSALPQVTLRGTAVTPADAELGQDEYIFSIAADGSTVTVMSRGGLMAGEKSAFGCGATRRRAPRPRRQWGQLTPQPQHTHLHPWPPPFRAAQCGATKWLGSALRRTR